MDVAPNQIASIAASLIPFLEHDDANRALMGSNMMRQAVPIIKPQAPIVGTGLEGALVRDSRTQIVAEGPGVVDFVDGRRIVIKYDQTEEERFVSFDGDTKEYVLPKYKRTNQSTTMTLRPIVRKGQRVEEVDVIIIPPRFLFVNTFLYLISLFLFYYYIICINFIIFIFIM